MRNTAALNNEELEAVAGGFSLGELAEYGKAALKLGKYAVEIIRKGAEEVTRKPRFPSDHPIIMNGNQN